MTLADRAAPLAAEDLGRTSRQGLAVASNDVLVVVERDHRFALAMLIGFAAHDGTKAPTLFRGQVFTRPPRARDCEDATNCAFYSHPIAGR